MAIENLYDDYYKSARKQEWYDIGAAGKAENVVKLCKPLNADSVLDIGAGNGALLQKVHEGGIGKRLCAVEISDSGLTQLRDRQKSIPGGALAEVKQFDGVHIPYPDNSFDLAILSHVIEHVEHPRLLLNEAARVARNLYAEVPLEDVSFKRFMRDDWKLDDTGHINYYTKDIFKRLLQTASWKPVKIEVVPASKRSHTFSQGKKGAAFYALKSAALSVYPTMAQRVFVYHCATLSQRADRISISLGDVLPPYDKRPDSLR